MVSSVLTKSHSRISSGAAAPLAESATSISRCSGAGSSPATSGTRCLPHTVPGPGSPSQPLSQRHSSASRKPGSHPGGRSVRRRASAGGRERGSGSVGRARRDVRGVRLGEPPRPRPQDDPATGRQLGGQQRDGAARSLDRRAHGDVARRDRAQHVDRDPPDLGVGLRRAALQGAHQQRGGWARVLGVGEPGAGGGRRGVEALAVGAVEGEVERFGHGSIMPLSPRGRPGSPRPERPASPGRRAGMPPQAGHSGLWLHHSQKRPGLGWKSPSSAAARIAGPDRFEGAGEPQQLRLVRLVGQRLAVGEVEQPQLGGHRAAQLQQHERVELHLEQRAGLGDRARRRAGLVVDDPDLPGGGDVEPVDVAAQQEPRRELGLHQQLPRRGLQPARILQPEVGVEQRPRRGQPFGELGVVRTREERLDQLGCVLLQPGPRRPDQRTGGRGMPIGGRQVVEPLQHRVHQRAAHLGAAGDLGQPVDGAEAVEQRALLEIGRAGRGERGPPRRRGLGRRRVGCGRALRHGRESRRAHRHSRPRRQGDPPSRSGDR